MNKIIYFTIACALTSLASAELVTYYSFDETDGDSIADQSGSLFGAPATLLNLDRIQLDVPGILGSGITFLGEETVDGIVFPGGYAEPGELSSAFRIGEITFGNDITFVTWINLPSIAPNVQDRIIDVTNGPASISTGLVSGWRILVNDGTAGGAFNVQLQLNDDGQGSFINQSFSELRDLQQEAWTFIAFRYNASDGTATMSILYDSDSGVDQNMVSMNSQSVTSDERVLTYGANMIPNIASNDLAQGNKFLNGSLDEMRLYDHLLTDEEIAALFLEAAPDSGDVTWANYPVEEDGTSVNTEQFLGWLDILNDPWVWSYSLNSYIYLPEANVTDVGGWIYIPK